MNTNDEQSADPGYQLPPFDWNAAHPADLLKAIAELGDTDMRLTLAASPQLTDSAAVELLSIGRDDIAEALCKNPVTSKAVYRLASRPKDAARIIRKAVRHAEDRAARNRSNFVTSIESVVPDVS